MKIRQANVVQVGMVGAGFLADTRARCYRACVGNTAEIAAVVAEHQESAARYAARWAVPHAYDDYRRLLDDPEIDVIDVCTPTFAHHEIAIAAAEAGKQVICTKPLTGYFGTADDPANAGQVARETMYREAVERADAMARAADASGVQLMYAENWVYAPAIREAVTLIEASGGAVLEMRGAEAHSGSHSRYAHHWCHSGGGAMLRMGSHPVGAALYLKRVEGMLRYGAPIRAASVMAEVGSLGRIPAAANAYDTWLARGAKDVEDWGTMLVTFTDGTKAVLSGSDVQVGGLHSYLDVTLSNARINCHLSPTDLTQTYTPDASVLGQTYLMEKLETPAGWSSPAPDEHWAHGHTQQIQDFVDAIAEGRPAVADGTLGRDVIAVIYAGYLSAAAGRRVELPAA